MLKRWYYFYIFQSTYLDWKIPTNQQLFSLFAASTTTGLLIGSRFLYKNIKVWTFLYRLRHISVMNVSLVSNFLRQVSPRHALILFHSWNNYGFELCCVKISEFILAFQRVCSNIKIPHICSFVARIISTNNWNNCAFGLCMSLGNLPSIYFILNFKSDQLIITRSSIDQICLL